MVVCELEPVGEVAEREEEEEELIVLLTTTVALDATGTGRKEG